MRNGNGDRREGVEGDSGAVAVLTPEGVVSSMWANPNPLLCWRLPPFSLVLFQRGIDWLSFFA